MLRAISDGEVFDLEMRDESPSIYLDHWALRQVSEDNKLATQFADGLNGSAGTLCLSIWNMVEFTRVKSQVSIQAGESFLEQCFPRLFFIECDPWQVIQSEDQLSNTHPTFPPHGDIELLRNVPNLEHGEFEPIGIGGILSYGADNSELSKRMDKMGQHFLHLSDNLREQIGSDRELRERVREIPKGPGLQRATRYLIRDILRPYLMDNQIIRSPNDASDFYHTVVPTSYCDLVILDRRWATYANQATTRLKKAGHVAEMAEVYSAQNGIDQALALLEKT